MRRSFCLWIAAFTCHQISVVGDPPAGAWESFGSFSSLRRVVEFMQPLENLRDKRCTRPHFPRSFFTISRRGPRSEGRGALL